MPVISFPDLPVSARRDEIADAIRDHQVVIVAGETGSGKTTQLPKICLQLGRGVSGMIGHTQPRRIAARAVADRIAHELGQKVGKSPDQVVGYQVRFTDEVGPNTLIKLMTDGILLAEIQSDPLLRRYDTLIIDEAHERSLNIDFILGYLARLLPARPDLKVIITSATIDSTRFAQHFGVWDGAPGKGVLRETAPVIEVSGRTYPVEIRYRPLSPTTPKNWSTQSGESPDSPAETDLIPTQDSALKPDHLLLEDPDDDLPSLGYGLGEDIDIETAICHAVDELCAEGDGDILVFLPGERDIRDVEQALIDHLGPRALKATKDGKAQPILPGSIEIVPLFARLSAAEQQRVFEPHSLRRVVLATNVAETSLTVPGIRYVIDPGLARISRYSHRTKVQRLPIEPISQASANQRAGRCGRVADGIAIRLFAADDFATRPAFTEPEILRTSLASVILQMAALGLGSVSDFPFLDPPDSRAVRDGIQLLVEIGALTIDEGGARSRHGKTAAAGPRLTAIGRDLARLPIDPRLGRMLIEADEHGCASEVLVIVAALSIQDVRERPLEHQQSADTAHARFTDPHSDFITYLNLWRYLGVQSRDLSGSQFRRMCRGEFLHYLRYREWRDVVTQLRQMARPLDLNVEPIGLPSAGDIAEEAHSGGILNAAARATVRYTSSTNSVDADDIHRSLLVGLLSNLGNWDEVKRDYQGARGTHFTIWPGSGLARSHPAWVMTAELVETSRLFARTVARIRPEWIEPLARSLVKKVHSEPYWSASKGAAMIKEKVLLYGMTLVAERPVLLGSLGDSPLGSAVSTPTRAFRRVRAGTVAGRAQGLGLGDTSADASSTASGDAALAQDRAELFAALSLADPTFDVNIRSDYLADALAASKGAAPSLASDSTDQSAIDLPATDAAPEHLADQSHSPAPPSSMDQEPGSDQPSARDLAREMFIVHALVRGEWRERHAFQQRNEELLDQAKEVERRSRTHALVADEHALCAFFDERIPDRITSAAHFNRWWKDHRRKNPDFLTWTLDLLLPRGVGNNSEGFPDHWVSGDMELPLSYQFSPGSARDGVTMTIPIEVLARVREEGTDWLVPGMLEELITESIRALPKAKRRLLAPAPEVGSRAAQWIRDTIFTTPASGGGGGSEAEGSAPSINEGGATHPKVATDNAYGPADASTTNADSQHGPTSDAAAKDGPAEDPMSLDAALGRLAAWGQRTGQARQASHKRASKKQGGHTQRSQKNGEQLSAAKDPAPATASSETAPTEQSLTAAISPASDSVSTLEGSRPRPRPSFVSAFSSAITVLRGVDLDEADLAYMRDHLPDHLRMTFVVIDRSGKELGSGPDLAYLQKTLASQSDAAIRTAVRSAVSDALDKKRRSTGGKQVAATHLGHTPADPPPTPAMAAASDTPTTPATSDDAATGGPATPDLNGAPGLAHPPSVKPADADFSAVSQGLHLDNLTDFPTDALPLSVDSPSGALTLRGFPSLVPQGDTATPRAGVRVMASVAEASRRHREGLAMLLTLRLSLATKRVTTRWTGRQALMLTATAYPNTEALIADAQYASALSLVDELTGEAGPESIRSRDAFENMARRARDLHEDRVYEILGYVVRAMEAKAETDGALRAAPPSLDEVTEDILRTVDALVSNGFLRETPLRWLPHIARYIKAGAVRIERATGGSAALDRDIDNMDRLHQVEAELADAQAAADRRPWDAGRAATLLEARWLVEELRVSLFAQQLGTSQKISVKRVLALVERGR
ncbi:MAG: DUF3418 domain-containing protein [Actinomycetaceae bacterium]|nr:DUF3418 domain-containing protein [Actinomycetaceae bacterium]